MEGRYPEGVVLVLTDLKGQDGGTLTQWLFNEHLPTALATGQIDVGNFYKNVGLLSGGTIFEKPPDTTIDYLFIYEVSQIPLAKALERVEEFFRAQLQLPNAPALDIKHIVPYEKTGPMFTTELTGRPVRGVHAVFTKCSDPSREEEFDRWYNILHARDGLAGGPYHTAYRYHNLRADQAPSRHLALYETDLDIRTVRDRMVDIWPQQNEKIFYVDTLVRVIRGAFEPLKQSSG